MTTREPVMVLVAHGTRSTRGLDMIAAMAEEVRERSDGMFRVRVAFVDVLGPSLREVLADLDRGHRGERSDLDRGHRGERSDGECVRGERSDGECVRGERSDGRGSAAVVVPAFLASGYHVHTDVPREVAASGHRSVAVTRALGPDPALAAIAYARLVDAGWRSGDAVVLAAAGSSDPRARDDVRSTAAMLADLTGTPVPIGYVATGGPNVRDVVATLRTAGHRRVFVASYLLVHGLFQQRLESVGADGVGAPLGDHPGIADLLVRRSALVSGYGGCVDFPVAPIALETL